MHCLSLTHNRSIHGEEAASTLEPRTVKDIRPACILHSCLAGMGGHWLDRGESCTSLAPSRLSTDSRVGSQSQGILGTKCNGLRMQGSSWGRKPGKEYRPMYMLYRSAPKPHGKPREECNKEHPLHPALPVNPLLPKSLLATLIKKGTHKPLQNRRTQSRTAALGGSTVHYKSSMTRREAADRRAPHIAKHSTPGKEAHTAERLP